MIIKMLGKVITLDVTCDHVKESREILTGQDNILTIIYTCKRCKRELDSYILYNCPNYGTNYKPDHIHDKRCL